MAVEFGNYILFTDSDHKILTELYGDILCYSLPSFIVDSSSLSLQNIVKILQNECITPIIRLCVLNPDETINYVIPNEDIVQDGIEYNENYVNGQRRSLSFKLINIAESNTNN
jgi:hypothetical protein